MEFDLSKVKDQQCWLYKYGCPCRTAGCIGLPDQGCPVYRWFKQVITENEENKNKV